MERNTCIAFLRMHIYEKNLRYVMIQIARRYVCVPRFLSFFSLRVKQKCRPRKQRFFFLFLLEFLRWGLEKTRVFHLLSFL